MNPLPPAARVLIDLFASWIKRQQQAVMTACARNRCSVRHTVVNGVLLTDQHQRRLAVRGNAPAGQRLADVAGIGAPDDSTLILIVGRPEVRRLYDGPPEPPAGANLDLAALVVRMVTRKPTWVIDADAAR